MTMIMMMIIINIGYDYDKKMITSMMEIWW